MAQPLTGEEKQLMSLLVQYVDANNSVSYDVLRNNGVPEKVKAIYRDTSMVLDSMVSRKLQRLRDKGWIEMRRGVYTILQRGW